MIPTHPHFQQQNPLRRPDWRWRRAAWLINHRRSFSKRRDDDQTRQALNYLRGAIRCQGVAITKLLDRFPEIHAARQLHDNGGLTELMVQARLLARQPSADIAALTGVQATLVDTYEALFFCCRDRIDACDWVVCHAIHGQSGGYFKTQKPTLVKFFAYHGGPSVLEAVLPFLLGGKDPFEVPQDPCSIEGRRELIAGLAVAVHLLPEDAATIKKLDKIRLLLLESKHNQVVNPVSTAILVQNLDARLAEACSIAPSQRPETEKLQTLSTVETLLRQSG
jgi:hypothetical protein